VANTGPSEDALGDVTHDMNKRLLDQAATELEAAQTAEQAKAQFSQDCTHDSGRAWEKPLKEGICCERLKARQQRLYLDLPCVFTVQESRCPRFSTTTP